VLFVATEFAWFFVIALPLAWLTRQHIGAWKIAMIAAGLFFYGWWRHNGPNGTTSVFDRDNDWWLFGSIPGRYCIYLLIFAVVNWALAQWASSLQRSDRSSRPAVIAAVAFDLGALFWFKYAEWVAGLLNDNVGTNVSLGQIILPIGVSFIAFQGLGYVIDVHREQQEPVTLSDFTSYLLFFPHIVAGPLVRVSEFVPQLHRRADPKQVDASRAFLLIASGFVKKVVISSYVADHIVKGVFANPKGFGGLDNLFAAYGYSIQIFCDFSGYTDIAIGLAMLLGIKFPQNFDNPYSATTMQDFWRRWHMSLSRWLRDYLYISLGGNRKGEFRTYVNLFLTMLIGGLWHGANMTFIVWGALHGGALVVERLLMGKLPQIGPAGAVLRWLATFHVVTLAWIFFNAASVGVAFDMIGQILAMFTGDFGASSQLVSIGVLIAIAVGIGWQFVPEWVGDEVRDYYGRLPAVSQGISLGMVIVGCYFFGSVADFIYFQF
jgi:alginate O-acetyltransferase complex protein AlgI